MRLRIGHPNLLQRLKGRCPAIELISGNFLDVELRRPFRKVLIYSVLHYLANQDELYHFVLKAAELLSEGGMLLIGDIADLDRKRAFEKDPLNQEFIAEWRRTVGGSRMPLIAQDDSLVQIDEKMIEGLCADLAARGYDVARLQQAKGLPFSYTREDVRSLPRLVR